MLWTNAKRLVISFYKASLIHKTFYVLTIIISILLLTNYGRKELHDEGFADATNANGNDSANGNGGMTFVLRTTPEKIYDPFYVGVYDQLLFSKFKNDFEIGAIVQRTKPTERSRVLDIGCGVGHHVSSYKAHGVKAVQGIDISPALIQKAKENYPNQLFTVADAMNQMLFPAMSFTHISCLYFTIYYMRDKVQLFRNCFFWLQAGGYLVLHLVEPALFDPIIPAGDPFHLVSPQSYAKERITSSVVKFDSMDYRANFKLNPSQQDDHGTANAIMSETFKQKNGAVIKNEHQLYMPSQAEILTIAKEQGFIVLAQIDMVKCQYANQFLYVLQKPSWIKVWLRFIIPKCYYFTAGFLVVFCFIL